MLTLPVIVRKRNFSIPKRYLSPLLLALLTLCVLSGAKAEEIFGPTLITDSVGNAFALSPDGQRIVYSEGANLWVAGIDGEERTELAEVDSGLIARIKVSADGQWAVFLAEQKIVYDFEDYTETYYTFTIHGVSLNGGDLITYADSRPFESFTSDDAEFEISPNSQRVVYSYRRGGPNYLYSQAIEGGDEYLYNNNQFGTKEVFQFKIAPDNSKIVFIARKTTGSYDYALYSAPLSGGTRTQLNNDETEVVSRSPRFEISPDSSFVIYSADPSGEASNGVYKAAIGGGSQFQLNDESTGNANFLALSPDGARVVYNSNGLYSVDSAGGTPTNLSAIASGNLSVSADSEYVVFLGYPGGEPRTLYLYSVPILGGQLTQLNGPLFPTGSLRVTNYKISADSSTVVYLADQERNQAFDLHVVPIEGGPFKKINETLLPGGDVAGNFRISPDNQRVVYVADQREIPREELYSVRLDGSDSVLLSVNAREFAINSTSTRVVKAGSFWSPHLLTIGIDGRAPTDYTCFPVKSPAGKMIPICL